MSSMLSIATNYACDYGCPEPTLRRIAEAGFTHAHWCHHWCHDFIYEECEIRQIQAWLAAYGLALNDLHASAGGREKCWVSPLEYEREAGANLVRNRIAMTARLGGDAIVMHTQFEPEAPEAKQRFLSVLDLFQRGKELEGLEAYRRLVRVSAPESAATIVCIFPTYDLLKIGFAARIILKESPFELPSKKINANRMQRVAIVGLGNPGKEYERTRHNVGFLFIDILESNLKNKKIILAKTQTFMNKSGTAVLALIKSHKIKPENVLVVHDDIDISWGKFKFSFGRSSAGHKGVESIIKTLKTKNFWRLRIGIHPIQNTKYKIQNTKIKADKIILKKFTPTELNVLNKTIKKAVSELETALSY